MSAYKTNNKTMKNTRRKETSMTAAELKALRLEIRFDKVSLGLNLGVPYRTLQDYESGARRIPATFAEKMRAEYARQMADKAERCRLMELELNQMYPYGIRSEINIRDDDYFY